MAILAEQQAAASFRHRQMRNAIAHGYFKVDHEIVWRTIHRDLAELSGQVSHLADQRLIDDDGHAP